MAATYPCPVCKTVLSDTQPIDECPMCIGYSNAAFPVGDATFPVFDGFSSVADLDDFFVDEHFFVGNHFPADTDMEGNTVTEIIDWDASSVDEGELTAMEDEDVENLVLLWLQRVLEAFALRFMKELMCFQ